MGEKRDCFHMQMEWLKLVQIRNQDCSAKDFLKVIKFIFISDFSISLKRTLRLEKCKSNILHIASAHSNMIFSKMIQQYQKETEFIYRLSQLRFRNKQHNLIINRQQQEAIKSREKNETV